MEGHSMGTGRNMVILGTLADSPFPTDQLVRDIVDADDCLKEQKPFRGLFGTNAKTRRMFAVQCLQCAYAEPGGASLSAAISSSVQTAVMLELMLVIMIASSANIISTSSHSSR